MNSKSSRITSIQIGLASPEKIREWSNGEVTKSETINYKSLKPEKDGLFDEAIFGPVKDYECACGKYKKIKFRGKICEKCGVEITESIVRRERVGHIELAAPIAHIWMTKELPCPSKISLVLDISYKEIEQVVYFVNYIVLDEGNGKFPKNFNFKEVIDLSSQKSSKETRSKLRKTLREIYESIDVEASMENAIKHKIARTFYDTLAESNMPFSIEEVFNFISSFTGMRFGIGAEAILELLKNIDLDKEYKDIYEKLRKSENTSDIKTKKLVRRLEAIKWLKDSNNKPEWMILKNIVVTPPDTRPIIQLEGGKFTTSDINSFYRKIIIRNERLKRVIQNNAPSIILNNEKRLLQEAVDALFDNASRKKPLLGKDKRPLKSLSEHLKGKQGLFRQNLLGKRVDYSGRSVIVIGPELKMYQVGIPVSMILKLFKPFIIHELIKKTDDEGNTKDPIVSNIKSAEKLILNQDNTIWPIINKVIKQRPVLLNRAPTLHRLGIQAFEPILVEGKAIRLHPLVTTAFNADFDGDQMAVHVPLSPEAVAEARTIILASWHILGPKDGKPIITPTQDMVLGNYYLTMEKLNMPGQGMLFANVDELKTVYQMKKVHVHSIIGIPTSAFPKKQFPKDGILITTVGKVILNDVLPEEMSYLNNPDNLEELSDNDIVEWGKDYRTFIEKKKVYKAFTKKTLSEIVNILHRKYSDASLEIVPSTMDKIKDIGFEYSTKSATTISAFDVPEYTEKEKYFEETDKKVEEMKKYYQKGLLTDDERYKKVVSAWSSVTNQVSKDIEKLIQKPEYLTNSIVIMANSGARGNISNFTQLSGMRGLMSKSYNYDQKQKSKVIKDTIEVPIKNSFIEGLTVSEYFNSSYGARKGMTDTAMKTSKSGYMTRKLVDATQDVIVNNEDCKTKKGTILEVIEDTKSGSVIESLNERLINRFPIFDVVHPKSKKVLAPAGEIITKAVANEIVDAGIDKVEVRSVLHCKEENGICQKCFGTDLTTNKLVEKYTAIGVIAAQSIGEPGTQLTMRTFHTGGVSSGTNIAQGFERLKQLFDIIPPKQWEKSIISEIEGKVSSIKASPDNPNILVVTIKNSKESINYKVPFDSELRVEEGDKVKPGSKITEGSIDVKELLKVAGIEVVRNYIIKEVQKVYRLQGIEIADKYIEVIIRQLTNKVQIQDSGNSDFFIGQIIDINTFRKENEKLILSDDKVPATAVNLIFGLDEAPSKTGSFLAAASFQDTKKILTDACVKGQIDSLNGLKENVIFGNLIPCGTGKKSNEDIIEEGNKMYELEY
ncbi:DNA-directed RNA polymerase subunit beta' [Malacoplasma penetrans]|uniref:DNA-directed RNA polymerase subunit beta' n=1 Tax=Malacoplasma penetrans (strain HF-2) TaxID=272633 RepID=RPOC_MALP2|nr:DNA-directed RNA polymerase subunit beta' [Malacoplasma penetrans]Q8EWX0.1 RecName: Full=DNA-directed RNA polymerase subunit beta'; Short=RNAP subunit beta'; AltName: Full=RNA polymerase subunit beta'; AltName: Full=Transcriptase subunit beta' [Malacoplasma penetrans HF-2]RXY97342.1 DNA-directed RNA polymerase subunit beta' [Malacoplasma penetrans]BAC43870.1 DNA-directed RNA polymerase subunit beta' [Malacoplasma penetrans HF-2]